jgi:hypothetical protein
MTGLKKSIAIQTVETILDTLSDDDFVQIIKVNIQILTFPMVFFSSNVVVSRKCRIY